MDAAEDYSHCKWSFIIEAKSNGKGEPKCLTKVGGHYFRTKQPTLTRSHMNGEQIDECDSQESGSPN